MGQGRKTLAQHVVASLWKGREAVSLPITDLTRFPPPSKPALSEWDRCMTSREQIS